MPDYMTKLKIVPTELLTGDQLEAGMIVVHKYWPKHRTYGLVVRQTIPGLFKNDEREYTLNNELAVFMPESNEIATIHNDEPVYTVLGHFSWE